MEAIKVTNPSSNSGCENSTNSVVKLIKLPKTNISVEKLPPITDDKVRLPATQPSSPLVQLQSTSPVSRDLKSFQGARKPKEPKFVPYEPYKAAITPLVATTKRKSSKGDSVKAKSPEKTIEEINTTDEVGHPALNKDVEEKYQREINALKFKLDETEKHL